jgi:hypothetical protein
VASAGLNTIPTHFALPALTRKQPMSSQIMFSQTTASQIRRSASLLLVGCSSLCLTAVVLVSFARPAGAAGPEEPRMQQANPADALVGVWKPSDMDVDIQVVGSGGQYQGVVVKAAERPAVSHWSGAPYTKRVYVVRRNGELVNPFCCSGEGDERSPRNHALWVHPAILSQPGAHDRVHATPGRCVHAEVQGH